MEANKDDSVFSNSNIIIVLVGVEGLMPWCKRCECRFSRIERENYKHPKLCGNCAREVERLRIIKIKEVCKNGESKKL